MVAGLDEYFADDAGDLRLDIDLVAGFDLACKHCGPLNGFDCRADNLIFLFFIAGINEEIHKGAREYQGDEHPNHDFKKLFHIPDSSFISI